LFSLDTNGDGVFGDGDQVFHFGYASDTFLVGRWKPSDGLTAAGGVADASAAPLALDATFRADLSAAIDLWARAGLDGGSLARLRGLAYSVSTLGSATLGLSAGNQVVLDATAAGRGWSEGPVPQSGRMDLTTALAHEMGHALGLGHSADPGDVMFDALLPGARKAPTTQDVDALIAELGGPQA